MEIPVEETSNKQHCFSSINLVFKHCLRGWSSSSVYIRASQSGVRQPKVGSSKKKKYIYIKKLKEYFAVLFIVRSNVL